MMPAGSRVLLTGATGGIGRAMLRALRRSGAATMGVSRSPADFTAADAADQPQVWVQGDLSRPEDIDRVARSATAWGADTLVHAAGVPAFGAFDELDPAEVARVLQLNLWSPIALTRALLPHLRQMPQARIVFVGSALGRIGVPGSAVYGASKAGLHRLAEALRRELAGSAVGVQWLAPRATRTAFNSARSEAFNRATQTHSDPPEVVAQALIELLRSGAAERHIGFPERLAVRLNGVLGPLMDAGFRKHRDALLSLPSEGSSS
ncbi:MAG: SDR family oxidoreductase [Hydrogenophaga sp.]|uniref:SDR family oxidoreductase n=1 Tax=Hydrogenophaga crocea TaxID=2716225 RepID=A0A6G8IM87_9BURK|nr:MULTISPECIES: SDR family oxidoreductase [Hydrogenophaga]MBL0943316.1 SDR family oxidoreductase [Hydrogenophaga sp.]QIM54294.1 SDR family oxidoreductase [Hydrogenophaga crocea]